MENLNAEKIVIEIQGHIKALKANNGCWENRGRGGWFNHDILVDAVAVITSQEQRIKELTKENEEKDETIAGLIGTIKDAYEFAVREMKARLDKNLIAIKDHTGKIGLVVLDSDIDQIAKEMVEGRNDNT